MKLVSDIKNIRDLEEYDEVEKVSEYEHKPLYKVRISKNYFLLKLEEENSVLKRLPILSRLHSFASKNEIKIYKWLLNQEFDFFKFPRPVRIQGYDILIEYLIPVKDAQNEIPLLIQSLQELYRKTSSLKLGKIHSLFHNMRYSSEATIYKGSFSVIRKQLGITNCFRTLNVVLSLFLKQKKLKHSFLLHNDFTRNNVIIDDKTHLPYIIDYQAASINSRWLLIDIVRYAYLGSEKIIDFDIVNKFIKKIDRNHFGDDIQIEVQVRYALIARSIQSLKWKPREHIKQFYANILLDDNEYHKWYQNRCKIASYS